MNVLIEKISGNRWIFLGLLTHQPSCLSVFFWVSAIIIKRHPELVQSMYYIVKESYVTFVELWSYKRKYQANLDLEVYYLLFVLFHPFISMLHFSDKCINLYAWQYSSVCTHHSHSYILDLGLYLTQLSITGFSFTYMLYFHHIAIRMLLDPHRYSILQNIILNMFDL